MLPADELRHLRSGPAAGETPGAAGLVEVRVAAPQAGAALALAREVLLVVVEQGDPAGAADLAGALPVWFVERCAADPAWTLEEWLGWFEPDERCWWWWSTRVEDDHHLRISVQVDGWPTPFGSLVWLLQAAGATSVAVDG